MKAEVICSNCGIRRVEDNYVSGEQCRRCGYKRTELIQEIKTP